MTGIVISMGAATRRAMLRCNLAEYNSLGMAMHAAAAEPRRTYMQGFAHMTDVEAEVEVWEMFGEWAAMECSAPYGVREAERHDNRKLWVLGRKVREEIDRLAAHPAYRGVAVLGESNVVLPAYEHDGRCAPTQWRIVRENYNGGRVQRGALMPRRVKMRGRAFTHWHFLSDEVAAGQQSALTFPG